MAKTTAWTATSVPLFRTRATARTTAVTHAAKRGPRTSTSRGAAELMEKKTLRTAGRARLDERGPSSGSRTQAAADAAQVHCAARGQQDAHGARVADHEPAPTWASTRAVSSSGLGAPLLRPISRPSRSR